MWCGSSRSPCSARDTNSLPEQAHWLRQSNGWRPPKPADTSSQFRAGTEKAWVSADMPKGSCSTQEGCDGKELVGAGSAETWAATAASSRPSAVESPWAEAAGCITALKLCKWIVAHGSPGTHLAGGTGPCQRPLGSSLRTVYLKHAIDAPCNFTGAGAIANAILIYLSTDPLLNC